MSYPSSLDNLSHVSSGQTITAAIENSQMDAINAVEAALGTNPFGIYSTVAAAITARQAARVATTAALASYTVSGNVLTASANGALSVDGVSVAANDRVLVKNETGSNQPNNGMYGVTQTGGATLPWILTRTADMNASGVVEGSYVYVREGTAQTGTLWGNTNTGAFTLGTTNMTWAQLAGPPLGAFSMNSQKITNVADPSAQTDATNVETVQKGTLNYAADTGSANVYAVSLSPAPAAYVAGMVVNFKAANANTGASTLNVNALGAKTIKKQQGLDLVANDIVAGQVVEVVYDGTNFQMVSAPTTLTTLGDTVYGGTSGAGTRLSGNTSSTKNFLTQTGTGSASAAPAWATIASSDVPKTLDHTWTTDFDTEVRTSRLDQMAAPTANVSMNSNKITNVTDPTAAQDAATKNYVDSTSGIVAKLQEFVLGVDTATVTFSSIP